MGQRTKARELALKCLYAYESTGQPVGAVSESLIRTSDLAEEAMVFTERLFSMVVEKIESIDKLIGQFSQNWQIERLAMVDRNILRISICELMSFPDVPSKVSINEGVELAKKYSTLESSRFVNGILDAVFKNMDVTATPQTLDE